jgi:hypothetical protein
MVVVEQELEALRTKVEELSDEVCICSRLHITMLDAFSSELNSAMSSISKSLK